MKKLESKLFQKFETEEVKNLAMITGGAIKRTAKLTSSGGSTYNDTLDTTTEDGNGNYPAADTTGVW